MKAIVRDPRSAHGFALRNLPDSGSPRRGQARVRMLLAPVNPADRLSLAGTYPATSEDFILGAEGVGIVEDGPAALVGQRVLPLDRGNWSQVRVVTANRLVPVPEGLSDAHAATLRINPATALRLLLALDLRPGEAFIQNAATSSVAAWVRRLAADLGLSCIDVARRQIDGMHIDGDDLAERLACFRPVGALDAVAGRASGRLAECLKEGSLITYGHLSGQPLVIPSMLLTQRDIRVSGFTLRRAEAGDGIDMLTDIYARLAALTDEPDLPVVEPESLSDGLARPGRFLIAWHPKHRPVEKTGSSA